MNIIQIEPTNSVHAKYYCAFDKVLCGNEIFNLWPKTFMVLQTVFKWSCLLKFSICCSWTRLGACVARPDRRRHDLNYIFLPEKSFHWFGDRFEFLGSEMWTNKEWIHSIRRGFSAQKKMLEATERWPKFGNFRRQMPNTCVGIQLINIFRRSQRKNPKKRNRFR